MKTLISLRKSMQLKINEFKCGKTHKQRNRPYCPL